MPSFRNADINSNIILSGQRINAGGPRQRSQASTTVATVGAGTYLVASLLPGAIFRDCAGAGRTDTTDTAANIISTLGLTADGDSFEFLLVNTSDAAETITLAGGTDVTLRGSLTVAQNNASRFEFIRLTATTVCMREA